MPQIWAPATSTACDELQNSIESIGLKHQPDNIIYTDGSRKEVTDLGLITGSGIYRRSSTAPLQLRVKPYGTGMLNTINRAELVAILVALRTCRPDQEECIATDSKCSMQKIARHLRDPASTRNDCHRPLVHEICKLLLQRARAGVRTDIVKVKSHIGIHGNEMADKLANEAAEARDMHWDFDLSHDFSEPFRDNFWPKQTTEVHTATETVLQKKYVRDLNDALKQSVHDKHKLGMSNQRSVYFQAWKKVQPHRVMKHSDAFWGMASVNASMKRSVINYRNGQLYNKKLACMRKQAYLPGEGIARDWHCPLCKQDDSGGHILGGCIHRDMKKLYIARHDKAMRTVMQAFTKGRHGSFYIIADVGREDGLRELGAHSKRVPAFVLPDECMQSRGLDPGTGRGLLQRGPADTRSKMRPDLMIVEMTASEQHMYLQHDDTTGARLRSLTPYMPDGKARRIWIVEGGYCSDTRYEEKLKEKEAQHQALQQALEDYGYKVAVLPVILGFSGSHFHTTTHAFKQLGIEHSAMATLMRKLHEHAVTSLHNIVVSRRVLERSSQSGHNRPNRNKPP